MKPQPPISTLTDTPFPLPTLFRSPVPLGSVRHFSGVPKGFDQNGPLLRREALKYRHMSSPSLLALGHFASNLDAADMANGPCGTHRRAGTSLDRKSVVWGKRVSVRVDLGGRRIMKTKNKTTKETTE